MNRYYKILFLILVLVCTAQEGRASCYYAFMTMRLKKNTLQRKIPFAYMDPLPGIARKLDMNLLEKKRREYLMQLSESSEVTISPETREEVLALIDAVKNKISQQPVMSAEDFRALVTREEKEFLRLLRKWKPYKNAMSPERFRKLVNIYHASSTKDFFAWKRIGGIFYPQNNLQQLTEMRSEHEILKIQMLETMRNLKVVSPKEYTFDTYIDEVKFLFRGAFYVYLNYHAIGFINMPYALPRPDIYNFIETTRPFFDMEKLVNNPKSLEGFVFYGKWGRKVYFIFLTYPMSMFFLELKDQMIDKLEEDRQKSKHVRISSKEEMIDQMFKEIVFQWREDHSEEMPSDTKDVLRDKLESLKGAELITTQYALGKGEWKSVLEETSE